MLFIFGLIGPCIGNAQVYRCPDVNGRPMYSNVSCDPQRPIGMNPSNFSGGGAGGASVISLMDSLRAEKDPDKRRQLTQSIRLNVATYKAKATAEAIAKAEKKAGVTDLEEQLKASLEADRASPSWPQYRSDSNITISIRQQLAIARQQVGKLSENFLASDTDYARVMARFAGIEN